jgi:hypothetical protein
VETSEEIPLTGGRITQGVVKRGDFVYRPCCSNSVFVHDVLKWLENKGITESPKYIGFTNDGREIISFLDGTSPNDLGWFNDDQLFEAGKIIKKLHDNLFDFPGCVNGQTVCHNDLSPCNFMFRNKIPYAVFDWDAAEIGDPINDIAYAVWLWLAIGNEDPWVDHDNYSPDEVGKKIKIIIDAYGLEKKQRDLLIPNIYQQMQRVGISFLKNNNAGGYQWTYDSEIWLRKYQSCIIPYFI